MAERNVQIKLLHSDVNNRPLPTTLELGEAVVNTADGIVVFSGDSAGLSTYEQLVDPAIPNATGGTYFEVGSNVYNLKIRNQITSYDGLTNLSGKFLSGTTSGFVLADISSIAGVDSYVSGGTFNALTNGDGTLTLGLTEGKPDVVVTGIDNFFTTGGTLVGDNITFTKNDGSTYGVDLSALDTNDTFVTGGTVSYVDEDGTITFTNNDGGTFTVTNITDVNTTGGTLSTDTITFTKNDGSTYDVDVSGMDLNDTYVTGGTISIPATDNTNSGTIGLFYKNTEAPHVLPFEDTFTTGGTLNVSTLELDKNDGTTISVDLSGLDTNDTFVTGFTYDDANTITIKRNEGESDLTVNIGIMTGLTVNGDVDVTGTLTADTIDANTILSGGTNLTEIIDILTEDTFVTGYTYDSSSNTFTLERNGGLSNLTSQITEVSGMTNTGNLDLQGELANSTGNVVINDALDISGNTTVWGNINPGAHLTYDLGADGQRWDELYVRKVRLGTTTTILEDGKFTVSGGTTNLEINPNGDMIVDGNVHPPIGSDLVYDIGIAGRRWNNLNVGSVTATGMTISGLDANSVVYTDGSGQLATEAGFEYNDTTNTMTLGNIAVQNTGSTATFGQGGVTIGSGGLGDLTVQGDLTVLGDTTTVSTSELYIEDPTITLNYNPTGSTNPTSLGAGWEIQDGDGAGTDVVLKIAELNTFDAIEYPSTTGPTNRAFYTNLNDIIIRQATDTTSPTGGNIGVRVLCESDCLDSGTY